MSRHLDKLQILIGKLEARYGQDDPAVRELNDKLKTLELLEKRGAALKPAPKRGSIRPAADLL